VTATDGVAAPLVGADSAGAIGGKARTEGVLEVAQLVGLQGGKLGEDLMKG